MIVSRDTKFDYLYSIYEIFDLRSIFAKRKMKFCLGEARAGREGKGGWGKGIPAPPERNFSKVGVGIFAEIRSDFI